MRVNPLTIITIIFLLGLMVVNLPMAEAERFEDNLREPYIEEFLKTDNQPTRPLTPRQILNYVAITEGVSEQLLLELAECESNFGMQMIGDTFMPVPSFGPFQINLYYHPDITKEQAMEWEWSATWTARQIKQGNLWKWSCADKLNLYKYL